MDQNGGESRNHLFYVAIVVLGWFVLTWLAPYYSSLLPLRRIHGLLPAALRMTLMFLLTWAYVRYYEKKTFGEGFGFSFRRFGRSLLWGLIIAIIATAVLEAYQKWVVTPLTRQVLEASTEGSAETVPPFVSRLVDYLYVVYEGIVEVLIFIGFLLDRLARRWKPWIALVASNVVFALWHYAYWRKGLLEGSLMIVLTFIAGVIISLGYLKTKNSFTSVVSHMLVDAPSGIKELLGLL